MSKYCFGIEIFQLWANKKGVGFGKLWAIFQDEDPGFTFGSNNASKGSVSGGYHKD